jgi:hypothetical protein
VPLSLARLHPRTVEKFRALYPRLDPYACEIDFQIWIATKAPEAPEPPHSYDAAFLGFAAKWAERTKPQR